MSYEQQNQKPGQNPQAQNIPSSSQNQSKTAQVGNNVKKDEPTAQSGKDRMNNEGGCSTSGDKSSQGCTTSKSSNA